MKHRMEHILRLVREAAGLKYEENLTRSLFDNGVTDIVTNDPGMSDSGVLEVLEEAADTAKLFTLVDEERYAAIIDACRLAHRRLASGARQDDEEEAPSPLLGSFLGG